MKKCKKCGADIAKNAKHCPHCGAKQGMPTWAIVLIVIVALFVIVGVGGSGSDSESDGGNKSNNSNSTETNIEYTKVTKDQLDDALDENAAAAKDTYNKKYVEVSGRLGTIDSDLKYISLMSSTDKYDIVGIHCYLKNDEQKEIVKTLKSDQDIVIKGQITDVGEVLGYYLDITEIITE